MQIHRPKLPQHSYLFKASWGGTALKFWIEASNDIQARKRAERYVFNMEGGMTCLEVEGPLEVR